ncbi:hypothetical protein AB0G04_43190 [Actinoplanes sp. NPDC023801]|uniref:hypothetical protein n=1 Tax=Actinoplanes sp. NPDC023801 TaxID=3154595 RepID=UPI0033D59974
MTPTRRLLAGAVLLLTLGCAACTGQPSEPADPPAKGTPPDAGFTSTVETRGQALHISYELTNRSDAKLIVFNRVPAFSPSGSMVEDPASVYVIGSEPEGRVQVAKRAFHQLESDRTDWTTTPLAGVSELEPGRSLREEFDVPLPLERRRPYGDDYGDGPVKLPDPVREVVFCVGAGRAADLPAPASPPGGSEFGPVLGHLPTVTAAQHLWCSEPFGL